jgi:hypothetical protein
MKLNELQRKIAEPQRKLSNSLRQFASLPVELIAVQ